MTTLQLNSLLGRELGFNIQNEPLFRWENSRDLWWPYCKTGRLVATPKEVPLIGGGTETVEIMTEEYRRDPMCPLLDNQWVVTLWSAPETLHQWQERFPGAGYPAEGYRIHTSASLPRFPGGPREPNLPDTEHFIATVKLQRRFSMSALLADMDRDIEVKEKAVQREVGDEIRDCFPAFANPTPGRRGGYVSVPYTKIDRNT